MKKIILSALLLFCFAGAFAQMSNVILFTENGERFYAVLNGLRMNDEPVTNLKVDQLNQPGYKLKVIFENPDLGEMNKNLYCQPGEETVYMIKQNKKGDYKLALRSSVPIAQAAPVANNTYLYHWGSGGVSDAPANTVVSPAPTNTAVTTTVVEETTTTTTTGGTSVGTNVNSGNGENVSMNVNVDGFGMNVNVNTSDDMGMTTTDGAMTTTTTTTTTTTSGGTVQDDVVYVEEPAPCAVMMAGDYESARASIKSKSFSDSKMTLAKQVTRAHCLTALQVKGIVELFDFESDRLEYAKYAYPFCYEQNKYYQVNDAFEFESSIEELDEYIGGMH